MSNIITARDPGIIAAEINLIKRQVQETVIYASIRIGEKLAEAKSMVPQGEWGRWLEENVEYSQSTAENLMKLYREYGGNQESLFDTWTNSQTFGKLTYTQHLALLALPFADRKEFAEENNVADMSTRQLQQAIRDRDDAIREKEDALKQLDAAGDKIVSLEAEMRDTNLKLLNAQQIAQGAKSQEDAWKDQIEKLKNDRKRAELTASDIQKQLEQAQKELLEAQEMEDSLREELKQVTENTYVPESLMEQIRKEAEAQAAAKVTSGAKKKLEKAQNDMDNAVREKEAAEKRISELEEKLVAAEKKAKMADPDMMEYNTLAQKLQADYKVMNDLRKKISVHDREKGEKLKQFQKRMVSMWVEALTN